MASEARLDLLYARNAPPGSLATTSPMQAGFYPPQQQGRTWQAPRSWWFYLCTFLLIVLIVLVALAAALAIILATAPAVVGPVVAAPVTGANQGAVNFASNAPQLTRLDALTITGSLAALTPAVSNVTGVGTAISVEQGGVEVWNGGGYFRDRIVSDTGIGYPSDRRVKRNIHEIDTRDSLDVINRLTPVTFDYMRHWALHRDQNGNPLLDASSGSGGGRPQEEAKHKRGFIAQDVKVVIPSAVDMISRTLAPDDANPNVPRHLKDFHVMDMSAIIPDLVGALQEMSKQLRALEAKNQELLEQQNNN